MPSEVHSDIQAEIPKYLIILSVRFLDFLISLVPSTKLHHQKVGRRHPTLCIEVDNNQMSLAVSVPARLQY